jgi:hypothetical protein
MSTFVERVIGAARLDPAIYEEVEHDRAALWQSLGVVALYGVAAGAAELGLSFTHLVASMVAAMIGWVIWASLTYVIGTRVLPEPATRADLGQLLRTLGFAAGPGIIMLLAVMPRIRSVVFVVAQVWMIAAMVIAVRQALDYASTMRAVAVCLIGWICQLLVAMAVVAVLAPPPRSDTREGPAQERVGAGSVGIVRPSAVAPAVH